LKPAHVIGIGTTCIDHLIVVPSFGHLQKSVCLVEEFRTQGGGLIATAMVAVARLGGRAELWGRVGDDANGRLIVEELKQEGVDIARLQVVEGALSAGSVVAVSAETGDRNIFYFAGRGLERADAASLPFERIKDAGCLLVDHNWDEAVLPALKTAREHGVTTCADLGTINEETRRIAALTDVLIVPRHCAEELAGGDREKALREMAAIGPRTVVITLGDEGSICLDEGRIFRQPAFEPPEVVDTTGAGDVFHGAYCFGVTQGWDTRRCIAFASAVAALKCTKLGGRSGIPDLASAVAFLSNFR